MKKQRGLRRYYRNLEKLDFIDQLDFSGSKNSWFDFYHIHIDHAGLGNKSWKSRKKHLDALFTIAENLEKKLRNYPKAFQYWIMVDEDNSSEDSIYIHTENPNGSEFPIQFEHNTKQELRKPEITKQYLIDKGLFDENDFEYLILS